MSEESPASGQAVSEPIGIDQFQKVALRVGKIVKAEDHPQADRLLVLEVDLGGETRQVVAGIKASYQPAELVGQHVVVVVNMKPAKLRGIESQGMVLAAQDGEQLTLVVPHRPIQAGAVVK